MPAECSRRRRTSPVNTAVLTMRPVGFKRAMPNVTIRSHFDEPESGQRRQRRPLAQRNRNGLAASADNYGRVEMPDSAIEKILLRFLRRSDPTTTLAATLRGASQTCSEVSGIHAAAAGSSRTWRQSSEPRPFASRVLGKVHPVRGRDWIELGEPAAVERRADIERHGFPARRWIEVEHRRFEPHRDIPMTDRRALRPRPPAATRSWKMSTSDRR